MGLARWDKRLLPPPSDQSRLNACCFCRKIQNGNNLYTLSIVIQFARLYRQKQLLHKTDLVEMFTVWKSYLHGFGVCTIHASRKYPQNVDGLSNIVPLAYFDRIKHLSVAIGRGSVDSQSVIERRLLNSKSPIEPGKDYIQPRRPRGCLAVQNSSIGDLVCLSDRTNNQSLHKPTEWSHTLVTFGTFDQSDEETWPDQKRSTYLHTYLPTYLSVNFH